MTRSTGPRTTAHRLCSAATRQRLLSFWAMLALLVLSLAPVTAVQAAGTFNLANNDVAGLIADVGMSGTTTINLATNGTYTLTAINNSPPGDNPNGLPIITGNVTINGNGATIERGSGAPDFRFFSVSSGGTLVLNNVKVIGGFAKGKDDAPLQADGQGNGGAIFNNGGTVQITNSTITGNDAFGGANAFADGGGGNGGAIFNEGGTLQITGSLFSNNSAFGGTSTLSSGGGGNGGAISSNSSHPLTIANSTFFGNKATGGNGTAISSGGVGRGGAISGQGAVTITGSTFYLNNATGGKGGTSEPGEGGAIYGVSGFTLNVTNSTITDNAATGGDGLAPNGSGADGLGGGIRVGENGSNALNLTFVTIAWNTSVAGASGGFGSIGSGMGGGVFTGGADLKILGTILAGNIAATEANCHFGGATFNPPDTTSTNTENHNLEFNPTNTCGFTSATQHGDPKLGLRAGNGGPTETLALTTGSAAIDTGGTSANGCPTTDQRGVTRPQGAACDIGAFEFSTTPVTTGLQFHSLPAPVRLLDTRPGTSACITPGAAISGNTTLSVNAFVGCSGVPNNAQAIVGNATVDNSVTKSAPGFVTLYPGGTTQPNVSNLNYLPGSVIPNAYTLALGGNGTFNVYAKTKIHIIIDITGYYTQPNPDGLIFYPLPAPVRLLDTRPGTSACITPGTPIGDNAAISVNALVGCSGVPATAKAIVGNATVTNNDFLSPPGFVTLFPTGAARPNVSNLNYVPGSVVPNAYTVGLGNGGSFDIYVKTKVNVIIDVTGYFAPPTTGGLLFYPLSSPIRLLDTRPGTSACTTPGTPISGDSTLTVNAVIACSTVPASAKAITGNATVTNNDFFSPPGFVTLFPTGAARPNVSNLNYLPGDVLPNAYTVGLGGGSFNIYVKTKVNMIIDIAGYFA